MSLRLFSSARPIPRARLQSPVTGDNSTGKDVLERPEPAHKGWPWVACKYSTQVCANNLSASGESPAFCTLHTSEGPVLSLTRVSFGADSASPSVPTRCPPEVNAVHWKAIAPASCLPERGNFECKITTFEEKLALLFTVSGSSHVKETPTPVLPKHSSQRPEKPSMMFCFPYF